MCLMQGFVNLIMENIGIVLVVVAVLYLVFFVVNLVRSHNVEGYSFSYRPRNLIAFLLILGIGIYCLVTGQNINQFIN